MTMRRRSLYWFLAIACFGAAAPASAAHHTLLLPRQALRPADIAVIVNDRDELSKQIGAYYQKQRKIPNRNIIHVKLPTASRTLTRERFRKVFNTIIDRTSPSVEAYLLTWSWPYRVECQSITTAFATGFDPQYCAASTNEEPCRPTKTSPYYATDSIRPFEDLHLRPTMLLPANNFEEAKALIDRGVQADNSHPKGTAYLVETHDRNRSVRRVFYPAVKRQLGRRIPVEIIKTDALRDRDDIMFYFTGATRIEGLDTLHFLPGAVADHLTSAGGLIPLDDKPLGQMSALRWLQAGATGSYGTVKEPCNFLQKFPNPLVLMENYLNGSTLIEAYWKSVAQPGEGLFIGEPLARPYGQDRVELEEDHAEVRLWTLMPGTYSWEASLYPVGPYKRLNAEMEIRYRGEKVILDTLDAPWYRVRLVHKRTPLDALPPAAGLIMLRQATIFHESTK